MPSYGQFGLDGPDGLSAFRTGSLNVDSGLTLRGEISRPWLIRRDRFAVSLRPYAFGAVGVGSLSRPTRLERGEVQATSYGLGLRSLFFREGNRASLSADLEYGRAHSSNASGASDRLSLVVSLQF